MLRSLSVRSTSCVTQLAAALASPHRFGHVQKVVDDRPALVHQHVGIIGRQSVVGFQPLTQRCRQFAERLRELSSTSAGETVTGTRSGSGK